MKKIYWMWRKEKVERGRYFEERRRFKAVIEKVQKEKGANEGEQLKNLKR